MSAKTWLTERLRSSGAAFEEVHHAEAYTAQQLAHNEHVSGRRVAKTVIIYADGKPLMLVLPATHRVAFSRLRETLGAGEIHLASESDIAAMFPDCELGAEPPLPEAGGLPVLMDPAMEVEGEIVFSAGTHRDGIRMPYRKWFELVRPSVAAFAVEPGAMPRRPTEGG